MGQERQSLIAVRNIRNDPDCGRLAALPCARVPGLFQVVVPANFALHTNRKPSARSGLS